MNPLPPALSLRPGEGFARPPTPRRRLRWWHVFLTLAVVGLGFLTCLVLSFRMGSEARILRQVVFKAAPDAWDRQIEVGVGRLPVLLAQGGLSFLDLEPQARAGIRALRCADVGVYHRRRGATGFDRGTVFAQVLQAMERRHWTPVVSVRDEKDLVAVFVPPDEDLQSELRACVFVMNDEDLVLVSARLGLQPLMDLIQSAAPMHLTRNGDHWLDQFASHGSRH